MSGPKISLYELSAWQRKNLMAQLTCTQNSFACVEQIKHLISGLNGFGGQVETLLDTLSFVNARSGGCADEINNLHDIQNCLAQDLSSFMDELSANMPVITDKATLNDEELNKKKSLLAKLKAIQSNVFLYRKKIEQTLSDISSKAQSDLSEIKSGIADDISAVSSFYITPDDDTGEQFKDLHKRLEDMLYSLSVDGDCPSSIRKEVLDAINALKKVTDYEYLNTFNAVTVIPLLKKYDDVLVRQEQRDSLDGFRARYSALCAIAQLEPKSFSADVGIESLTLEIVNLEKQVVEQAEQTYISGCVNEVMAEMGYDLVGNRAVTKRSGKKFKNELFSYSDGTAINVTYDSEGQIAMELGGIDRADRVPTSDETNALCEDMESFCTDFKVFEEKLKAKGVSIRSRVSMSPPAAEYATIINVDDYNITTVKPISELTIKNKRKKAAAKQTLRRDGN